MKKIEPVLYQVGQAGECVSPHHITVGDIIRGATPLYTREAIEVVANQINHAAGGEIDIESILTNILGE